MSNSGRQTRDNFLLDCGDGSLGHVYQEARRHVARPHNTAGKVTDCWCEPEVLMDGAVNAKLGIRRIAVHSPLIADDAAEMDFGR